MTDDLRARLQAYGEQELWFGREYGDGARRDLAPAMFDALEAVLELPNEYESLGLDGVSRTALHRAIYQFFPEGNQ
jgi:hypothetical protein